MQNILKVLALAALIVTPAGTAADDIDDLLTLLDASISGERARDYTMRLWRWDKWNDLPAWNGTAREAQAIMQERGFDEALVVDTPADGVTKYGDWTNPVGWDVTAATLEVVEPAGLPAEYRYLCDYSKNPTSLTFFSAPTPPNGIETELFLYENMRPGDLATNDVRGKIILTSQSSGSMKRYLAPNGIPGMITSQIERNNADFVNAVQWQNTWSDLPGGWVTTATDDKSTFCFGISPKQGEYLRNILRSGRKVKVRAVVDSRYYTDGSLPYITGAVHGTMGPEKDVLIVGHLFEYGANDNGTGCASFIEAIGTINDLIRAGKLPRPKRSLRVWMGFERYGSLAYTQQHIDRLRNGTLASLCCDTPAASYDLATTKFSVAVNLNVCPSFTDALLPEIAGRYHERYANGRTWAVVPFRSGTDNFFGDAIIGVPLNSVSMNNGGHLHHNSMDTIDKTDPRTLRALATLNAAFLYTLANLGEEDVFKLASLSADRGMRVIFDTAGRMTENARNASDGAELGRVLAEGEKTIKYYTALQNQAIESILRAVPEDRKRNAGKSLSMWYDRIEEVGKLALKSFQDDVKLSEETKSIRMEKYKEPSGEWEKQAASLVPSRTIFGPLTLDGIPPEQWVEVNSSPRWWSAGNWPVMAWYWVDGKRSLLDIRDYLELEAGRPVRNFDLVKYFRFLESHGLVTFNR